MKKNVKEEREETVDSTVNAGLAGAASETVSNYGSGIKEHIVAYKGVDNETGQKLKRSLKQTSESKVNPKYKDQNLKQQAGFSAETKEVARQRAEEAISGKKPKTVRTDDIPGHVNDPLFDITCKVDANGNPVPGASMQVKFVGATPKDAVSKMLGKNYQKYVDNNCKMLVPSDYYDDMKKELSERIESLKKQIESLKKHGKADVALKKQALLEKCKKLRNNLRKSSVSNAEAMEARTNPKLSTTKDIAKIAHRAGMKQAKTGAVIGGSISIVRNAVDYFKDKKDAKEAMVSIGKDTAIAAGSGYITGSVGSAVKGAMQNSTSKSIRSLSKTNLPAFLTTTVLETGKTLSKYFKGDIDGTQCLEELGEKGFGMVNGAMFGAIGQVVIPIPIVGALAGSMIGYTLSSLSYKVLTDSLKSAKIAHDRRIAIEKECNESIKMLKEYRHQLEDKINEYLKEKREFFDTTFQSIKDALQIGDVDGYISAMNMITTAFGKEPLYANMDEFNELMTSNEDIVL